MAWQLPPEAFGGWVPKIPDLDAYEDRALAALRQDLRDAKLNDAGVTVIPLVRNAPPAEVLCQESRDADMLVVGSRGLGGFKGLLLGSVSQECAQHALCPVVIVRAPSRV